MRAPRNRIGDGLERARQRRRELRGGLGLALVAWYLLASSCALYDVIDAIGRLAPFAATSLDASSGAAGSRCAHHACGCASSEACRQHCCCADEPAPRRPDAPRPSGTERLLCALACHGGSNGGVALVPALDPAVVAASDLVFPPRVHAAIERLAPAPVVALDADALDKVPIATA